MNSAPKSVRLHIGLFGRTNVGKSSFLNRIAGQDVAIVSPVPGTTTDVVEKAMELLPIGPVVVLDTAGLDDRSPLGAARALRARAALERSDVVVLVVEPGVWGPLEEEIVSAARQRRVPVVVVINKTDLTQPADSFVEAVGCRADACMTAECADPATRRLIADRFRECLLKVLPDDAIRSPPLLGDLVPAGGWIVLVVPIDLQAPKGRLILPQVQAIRDALDHDAMCVVIKERELGAALRRIPEPPALAVCDSQVVLKMVADLPPSVPCTTFSILFARSRGDLMEFARGAAHLDRLSPGARVLIAEACSHHALEDDIGRVKIPRWLRRHVGGDLHIEHCQGRDFPDNLTPFDLVVHCGACMLTRREVLRRIELVRRAGVPITNYGLCIAATQGVLERTLGPFPEALEAWRVARAGLREVSP